MISGQSPESRYERRKQRHDNEEVEAHLAQTALDELVDISCENNTQKTDTTDVSNTEM